MREITQYVAVYNSGEEPGEEFGEYDGSIELSHFRIKLCERLVKRLGLSAICGMAASVDVAVFKLKIVDGQLMRYPAGYHTVKLPLAPMTADDYHAVVGSALVGIPLEFHEYIKNTAYSNCHAFGYEAVLRDTVSLANTLQPIIDEFARRVVVNTASPTGWTVVY